MKKIIKKEVKKEVKGMVSKKQKISKEVWGTDLDKRIAQLKKTAKKNGGVAMFIMTSYNKGMKSEAALYSNGENAKVFIYNFLKSMNQSNPEATQEALMRFVTNL